MKLDGSKWSVQQASSRLPSTGPFQGWGFRANLMTVLLKRRMVDMTILSLARFFERLVMCSQTYHDAEVSLLSESHAFTDHSRRKRTTETHIKMLRYTSPAIRGSMFYELCTGDVVRM